MRSLTTVPSAGSLDRVLGELRDSPARKDGVSPYLWWDQKYFLPDDILNKVDRMSMAHSLEVRPPFLDHRIVEFAATLPLSLKMSGARQKIVLKHLMKSRLPGMILKRKKTGLRHSGARMDAWAVARHSSWKHWRKVLLNTGHFSIRTGFRSA